tara:strand:+ start:9096 stop:10337 length:1242 start_codon:yes stop_codon:yes gene_type:complete
MNEEKEREVVIQIPTVDDSSDMYGSFKITWTGLDYTRHYWNNRILSVRNNTTKDPILHAVRGYFKEMLGRNRLKNRKEMDFSIGAVPILLEGSSRYYMNGKSVSFNHMLSVLARVAIKSIWTDDTIQLQRTLLRSLNISEDVRYVLENRMPYNFYKDFEKVEVRLNVQQIGFDEYAIEVSDGIWGTMNGKEITSFCSFFLHGKKTGKWKFCSPNKLFLQTVGRKPTNSELELMIPFLEQNRTKDLIEQRAQKLVQDMVKQFSDRITLVYKNNGIETLWTGDDSMKLDGMIVRGKGYDWYIRDNGNATGTQRVSTYVLGTKIEYEYKDDNDEDALETRSNDWKGPICIDNATNDAPLGDQMCARAFAALNDIMMLKRVSTIRGYIRDVEENSVRLKDTAFELERLYDKQLHLYL